MIRTARSIPELGKWLVENARSMSDRMFSPNRDVDWRTFNPDHILALRAVAPDGVFTETIKANYLERVADDTDLAELADFIFEDDYTFVLRVSRGTTRVSIVMLMKSAYDAGIRPSDPRVKAM